MQYPEHLYDRERLALVQELVVKELSKLFPNVQPEDILENVIGWRDSPEKYHLESATRDFWDIFSALFEQIKLKPGFTQMFSAANFRWSRETINVNDIQLTSPLKQITQIPGLNLKPNITVKEVVLAAHHALVIDEQRAINDTHSSESQDAYAIIVLRQHDGVYRVMDGNRRSLRAGLYGKPTIEAWVGESDDKNPREFWVPIGELYQLVHYYKMASSNEQRQAIRNMLEALFQLSSVARISYENRIAHESDLAAQFLATKPTI